MSESERVHGTGMEEGRVEGPTFAFSFSWRWFAEWSGLVLGLTGGTRLVWSCGGLPWALPGVANHLQREHAQQQREPV